MVTTARQKKTAKAVAGELLTTTELARIFGVSRNKIQTYVRQGMPIYDTGGVGTKGHRFDTQACINWMVQQEVSHITGEEDRIGIDEIKRRTAVAEMEMKEIDLLRAQEKYAEIDLVIESFAAALSNIRGGLMSILKISPQLENLEALDIEERLNEEVKRVLTELNDFDTEDDVVMEEEPEQQENIDDLF